MKLVRLKLNEPFRSLPEGFDLHFLREWDFERALEFNPYCLVGRNGSGKSNVLEALAAIFFHIECIYLATRPDGFEFDRITSPYGFQAEVGIPDAYELEYFLEPGYVPELDMHRTAHLRIYKIPGQRPEMQWLNRSEDDVVNAAALSRGEVKAFLPKYIIGYSSGHNEILSLPFLKMRFIHFDEYREFLTKETDYGDSPEGRLIYLDDEFSQAILLCHYLFPSAPILRVFKEKIGVERIRRFQIIIRRHHRLRVEGTPASTVSFAEKIDEEETTVELTSKLSWVIDKLIQCSSAHYEDHSAYEGGEGYDLTLDYWINDATKQAFRFHFGVGVGGSEELSMAKSALHLFQLLQTLLTLNYYQVDDQTKKELYQSDSLYLDETIPMPASHERIMRFKHFEIIKNGVSDSTRLYSKALSDGEHQLLHTIGLCLLFRHEPALFLLDEPETHLNPDWRASYISTLREALEADSTTSNVTREVLLTSHSPFVVSDCKPENVLVFKKNAGSGKVSYERPDFNTFGASANAITMKVFGQTETIGDFAMSKLNALRERLDGGEDPQELIDEAGEELGDSVEKVLFVHQALKRKEGK
jgi:restriction system-associated AAA family ATPase